MQKWRTQRYKKVFKTVLQILAVKVKGPKNSNIYWQDICNVEINFSNLNNRKMLSDVPKKGQFEKIFTKRIRNTFC